MNKEAGSNRRAFIGQLAKAPLAFSAMSLAGQELHAKNNNKKPEFHHQSYTMNAINEKKFVPVMITPYTDSGAIDYNTLSALIDFYLAAGVKGFFANCLSSEMYALSPEERLSLTRFVVKRVNGAVPVVATGSFGNTMEEKVEFTKKMYHTGINAVILITSHFATEKESDDILIDHFNRFFELTDNIPMGTYECPSPYKRILTPKVFTSLLESNRLIYHKDTAIDFNLVKGKLDLIKNNRIEFYDAHTPNTMYSLQAGAKGMSAIAGNFYPEIFAWMCNNANNPNKQKDVEYMQAELTKADGIISSSYPMSSKYFLNKRGVPIQPISRTSKAELTSKEKETLDSVYKTFNGWCERLEIKPS